MHSAYTMSVCVPFKFSERKLNMGTNLKGKELGEGISQRKDGRYQGRYTDRFGKRKYVYDADLSELKKRLRKVMSENDCCMNVCDDTMTLNEWFEEWIATYKSNCTTTTINSYRAMYVRIADILGDIPLSKLNAPTIQRAINRIESAQSQYDTLRILKGVLKKAVDVELLLKNPAKNITTKKIRKQEEQYAFSDEQMGIFLEEIKNTNAYPICVVGFGTGMRIGDDDDKIRLNQRKPSKYKGLRRFGPEKNLQRINKFMKERPIFYKNLIQMKENIRFYLRCFYCITKVMILQFNSENRTELARNG